MPRLSKIGAAALAAFGWTGLNTVSASYLQVAGGGGGSSRQGAGGGAGGYLTGTTSLNTTQSYTVVVGAGGAGGLDSTGINGSNSQFGSITASVGGGAANASASLPGNTGGSGGGGNGNGTAGGAGTSGQGNAGGAGVGAPYYTNGGGGGAGAAGTAGNSGTINGAGGVGLSSSISGTSTFYAGGGGGGAGGGGGTPGAGGNGGGGAGGANTANGTSGTANTGGGGGGGGGNAATQAGAGGSGVVIISYTGAQQFGGGVVTSSGGNTIHTFTTSGTLSPLNSLTANFLVIAGGGAGGNGSSAGGYGAGGGGAGGYRTSVTGQSSGGGGSAEASLTIDTNSIYLVTVGAGGASGGSDNGYGNNGNDSAFLSITSVAGGGGGGVYFGGSQTNGRNGGSGGGGGNTYAGTGVAGGSGTANQGFAGGTGDTVQVTGAGGGGAGGIGGNAQPAVSGGTGGIGVSSNITGSAVSRAGGGGGGYAGSPGGTATSGGGAGGANSSGVSGTANTGGGGGGTGGGSGLRGGSGGSGIVIISYPGSTQQMAGGTVTVAGGNVIHTFTSSGYLTPIVLVNNSLRFRGSSWLNRTPTVSGSGTTFTWSGWIKRGLLGGANLMTLYSAGTGDAALGVLYFDNSTNKLSFLNYNGAYNWNIVGTPAYRDPSAWYHIVAVVDTTQATSSNRIKLYVNGVEITAFDTASYPSLSYSTPFFNQSGIAQFIGRWGTWNASHFYDGYMTEINFIDGQALTPNSFGSFNGLGVWQPIRYGGSYGTNGFYLPFTNTTSTTTLGYDFSPNGNNFTTNNISLTAGSTYDSMTDVPTLTSSTTANYCVMNPINSYSSITVNNGNLQLTLTEAAYRKAVATMAFPTTGTYYLEATVSGGIDYVSYGIVTPEAPLSDAVGQTATGYGAITGSTNWDRKNNGSTSGNFWTISTSNPTLQIAYNATSGKLWLGYNNTWLDSSGGVTGNPSAGTNETFTVDTTRTYLPSFGGYKSNSIVINLNFGQRPFTYTPPTGFVRLNTFNLPTPTIPAGNLFMNATLYTGNGSAATDVQTITNGVAGQSFQPDLVWTKSRSNAVSHHIGDSVRGIDKTLFSNLTAAEASYTYDIHAFNSNGFTVGNDGTQNTSGYTYVAWQWRASNATAVTNTNGSIISTVSANTTAGFSIATLTTQSSGTGTFGHGLGVAPSMVICKYRSTTSNWFTWHTAIAGTDYLTLNTTSATTNNSAIFSAAPTSTVVNLGTAWGGSGQIVAYCFAQIAGYSAFGSYTGNGSSDGPFVYTGFRPAFIMVKSTVDSTRNWSIWDNKRNTYNVVTNRLLPNDSIAEVTGDDLDFTSNGFKIRRSGGDFNISSSNYIYMAFCESPFKYSLGR